MNDSAEIEAALRADVEQLAAPGAQRVGPRGHDQGRDYLLIRLAGLAPSRPEGFRLPVNNPFRMRLTTLLGLPTGEKMAT